MKRYYHPEQLPKEVEEKIGAILKRASKEVKE
jgi:hypothetical protein